MPRIPVCRRLKQEECSSTMARLGYEVKDFQIITKQDKEPELN